MADADATLLPAADAEDISSLAPSLAAISHFAIDSHAFQPGCIIR
jgi:hypothetical protein